MYIADAIMFSYNRSLRIWGVSSDYDGDSLKSGSEYNYENPTGENEKNHGKRIGRYTKRNLSLECHARENFRL